MGGALEQEESAKSLQVPRKSAPVGRQERRGHVECQRLLNLLQQVERVAALAVELVDNSDDLHVAQAADLEELAGLLLDPLGAIGDRGQGAAGGIVSAREWLFLVRRKMDSETPGFDDPQFAGWRPRIE